MPNKTMQKLGEERSEIRELFEYGNARKREIGAENVFDFSLGNPSVPAPPIVDAEIRRLVRETPPEVLHGYTSAPGIPDVKRAVANYITNAFRVPMSEELVYMTCGAAASLVIALSALTEKGDEIIVPAPFFPEYSVFVAQAGAKLVPVPTDRKFHLDVKKIEAAITPKTRAVLINSPNNPTGAVYTKEEMVALGAYLKRKSAELKRPIYLLADEPYRELCFVEPPVYPMAVYENTLVLYSFSKSLSLAGERIGYIAVSPKCKNAGAVYLAVCGAGRSHGYVCAPALMQRVVASCLGKSSDIEKYRENRDLLLEALERYGYECIPPEGAFYLFLRSPEPSAKKFCERAKKYELLFVPSDSFGVEGYVRISYCVPRETVINSLPAFEKLIKEYR